MPNSRNKNVIIIVIDTLRKDYAGMLEHVLEKEGFVSYENVITPSSWTIPSHASIFTGLYPLIHGAHETLHVKLPNIKLRRGRSLLLPTILSKYGFNTYLLTANPLIHPAYGFLGFRYRYEPKYLSFAFHGLLTAKERLLLSGILMKYAPKNKFETIEKLVRRRAYKLLMKLAIETFMNKLYLNFIKKWSREKGAKDILNKLKNLNFSSKKANFIFINLMEVHGPHPIRGRVTTLDALKGEVDMRVIASWRYYYRRQVDYITRIILKFIDVFNEKNLLDNSLIIVTSDHGELLGEDGRIGHGTFLYDELLRVPLLIKYPPHVSIKEASDTYEYKYVSLTKIRSLVLKFVRDRLYSDEFLYSDTVFAESFGIPNPIPYCSESDKSLLNSLEKYRLAIYYNGFKGLFNVSESKFEELKNYNNEEAPKDIIEVMRTKVIRYLDRATKFIKFSELLK